MLEFAPADRDGPFYAAQALGYYQQAGLNVQINPSNGQAFTMSAVAAHKVDFGVGDSLLVTQAIQNGTDIRAIMVLEAVHPAGILSWARDNITTLKQLEGRTILTSTGGAYQDLLKIAMEKNNVNYSKVSVQFTSAATLATGFLSHPGTIITWVYDLLPQIQSQAGSNKLNFLLLPNYGLNIYGYMIYTTNEMIRDHPQTVQAFVSATLKGMQQSYKDPSIGGTSMAKYVPGSNATVLTQEVAAWAYLNANTTLGYVDPAKMESTLTLVSQALHFTPTITADRMYTNQFVQTATASAGSTP